MSRPSMRSFYCREVNTCSIMISFVGFQAVFNISNYSYQLKQDLIDKLDEVVATAPQKEVKQIMKRPNQGRKEAAKFRVNRWKLHAFLSAVKIFHAKRKTIRII